MNDISQRILAELQNGLKLEVRPYASIARKLNITEEQVLETIRETLESGVMRRMGVALRPSKIGFPVNALVAFEVKPENMDEVGTALASYDNVSHCYERECPEGWTCGLFAMIHASSDEEFEKIINDTKKRFDIKNVSIYKTVKELKKASVRYF